MKRFGCLVLYGLVGLALYLAACQGCGSALAGVWR